jgi:hypothetical protein
MAWLPLATPAPGHAGRLPPQWFAVHAAFPARGAEPRRGLAVPGRGATMRQPASTVRELLVAAFAPGSSTR